MFSAPLFGCEEAIVHKFIQSIRRSCLLILTLLLLAGCTGPQELRSPPPRQSKPVIFNANNAQAVAVVPFYFNDPESESIAHAWDLTLATADNRPVIGIVKPVQLLIDAFSQSVFKLHPSLMEKPGQTSRVSFPGCQGLYVSEFGLSPDDSLDGTISFQQFSDDCARFFDGTVSIQGRLDSPTGKLSANLELESWRISFPGRDYNVKSRLKLVIDTNLGEKQLYKAELDMDLSGTNDSGYRLRDFRFEWNRKPQDNEISLAGELTFDQFGTVKVETDAVLVLDVESGLPYNGVIMFYGEESSWVRLMFPRITYPGAFRINGSDGLDTMGTLGRARYE